VQNQINTSACSEVITIKTIMHVMLLITILVATSCSKVETFEATIVSIESNQVMVNCSSIVNRNKKDVEDIGYICSVLVTEKTVLKDKDNNNIVTMSDFEEGDQVQIYLLEPLDINVENRTFEAKEIKIIN